MTKVNIDFIKDKTTFEFLLETFKTCFLTGNYSVAYIDDPYTCQYLEKALLYGKHLEQYEDFMWTKRQDYNSLYHLKEILNIEAENDTEFAIELAMRQPIANNGIIVGAGVLHIINDLFNMNLGILGKPEPGKDMLDSKIVMGNMLIAMPKEYTEQDARRQFVAYEPNLKGWIHNLENPIQYMDTTVYFTPKYDRPVVFRNAIYFPKLQQSNN